MDAAHDIDALCPGNQLQRNLKSAKDIYSGEMPDDAAVRFWQLEVNCGRYRAKMGTSGRISRQSFSTNSKASEYMVMIMSSFRWLYRTRIRSTRSFLCSGPGFRLRSRDSKNWFRLLIPPDCSAFESPLSVSTKMGSVGFVGMQDQNVLRFQAGLRLSLGMGRNAELPDQENQENEAVRTGQCGINESLRHFYSRPASGN